jgi:peroxiredoxin
MFVDDGVIKQVFAEPDVRDNPAGVGVQVSDAETMLAWLKGASAAAA